MSGLQKLAIGHAKLQPGRICGKLTTWREVCVAVAGQQNIVRIRAATLPASINDFGADRAGGEGLIGGIACSYSGIAIALARHKSH
jgi:hypothetical protein